MSISQKCQYAIRALLELAKRSDQVPVRSSEIAAKQAIPQRFLENILNELKTAGLVEARRGVQGGFVLACKPDILTVGRVIRLVDGSLDPVRCTKGPDQRDCPLKDRCSLLQLWEEAKAAVEAVYDRATFAELAKRENAVDRQQTAEYCI
ncbi:MAG: Rrf2 family transcriptional regulator [Phycisphaerae bacterium]|jgi:Rrf2 family cysteine metabolism transcriptional repressor|nr:Rrf2 family transcriptional regulator [Phycisphaerae bacterium]